MSYLEQKALRLGCSHFPIVPRRNDSMQYARKILLGSLFLLIVLSMYDCSFFLRKEAERPEESLKPVRFFYPTFRDDTSLDSLVVATKKNLEHLKQLESDRIFHYGQDEFTLQQVCESQEAFLALISKNLDTDQLNRELRAKFRIYRASGRSGNSRVLFTGYYEPVFDASLTPNDTFKYPLYREPPDLLRIDLSRFSSNWKGQSIVGRLVGQEVVPYYSRCEIETKKALEGKNLEIAWLRDPVDVAFLHIQGSGRLKLTDGTTISVGYKASNGHPYRSIGRCMLDRGLLRQEEMSMQAIRGYFARHPEMIDEVLNYNPSYVFFTTVEGGPLGSTKIPLTPGRSVALDGRLFPEGALAFISCQKPVLNDSGDITGWTAFSRFVLNQDTGGAIRGAGRADIFWGSGSYAEVAAGYLRHEGDLYVLIKKP